ncbi:MAG: transposase [Planctomycetota bacterium]|jgi:hypothetical protein
MRRDDQAPCCSDRLDFIAELTQHIPEPRKHLVRYFGWYSNKTRGRRAKTTVTATGACGWALGDTPADSPPLTKAA